MSIGLEKLDRILEGVKILPPPKEFWAIPPNVPALSRDIQFIDSADKAEEMLHTLLSCDVSLLAIDTEFRYGRKKHLKMTLNGTPRSNSKEWVDIKSIEPLLLSVAAVVGNNLVVYVVDLRVANIASPIQQLLNSGPKLSVHYLKAEYHCLRTLGISLPENIYDTCLAAKALNLGKHHHRYTTQEAESDEEATKAKDDAGKAKSHFSSLVAVCNHHGIKHKFATSKDRLRQSFDKMKPGQSFTTEQIAYAAEDAIVTAQVTPKQMVDLMKHDLLTHMEKIEFPYALANLESEWHGVLISEAACQQTIQGLTKALDHLRGYFTETGVGNPNSPNEIYDLFSRRNLMSHFRAKSKVGYSFRSELLEQSQEVDESIKHLYHFRKYQTKLSDKLFRGDYVASDGRVHASLNQLGSDTGRTTSTGPSINSIGKIFRPIVIPAEGYLIGEADLCQIEMGVLAAISGNIELIEAYNTGDIYCAAAKRFYWDDLTENQRRYSVDEFKGDPDTKKLRNRMKIFCLGVVYNMSDIGVARSLGISKEQARVEIQKFFALYPSLQKFMEDQSSYGGLRGYARSITGLKRFRARAEGLPSYWETNWLRNMPIQASAADLFKVIVTRLSREYRRNGTKLILQVYDAVVFEAPAEHFQETATRTKQIMEECVTEMFPVLRGQADLNVKKPHCWNKDGIDDSIQRFLKDPEFHF